MKNIKMLAAAAFVGVFGMPANAVEEVKIGVPSWTGAQAIANLLGAVVELKIGGKVEYVPGNNATIFQAMDQGKGDIDVHPDVWLPNQESFTKKYGIISYGLDSPRPNPYIKIKRENHHELDNRFYPLPGSGSLHRAPGKGALEWKTALSALRLHSCCAKTGRRPRGTLELSWLQVKFQCPFRFNI